MKLFVFCVVVFTVFTTVQSQFTDKFLNSVRQCFRESEFGMLTDFDLENPKIRKPLICSFNRSGLLNEDGSLDKDKVEEALFENQRAPPLMLKCFAKTPDPEYQALSLIKCQSETLKKVKAKFEASLLECKIEGADFLNIKNEQSKQQMECMFKKVGIIDSDGKLSQQKISEFFNDNEALPEYMLQCITQQNSSTKSTKVLAVDFYRCMFEK